MRLPLVPIAVAALLAGCAGQPLRPAELAADCGRPAEAGVQTRLVMVRKLLESGHPYAALAHLDAAGLQGTAASHLRADILRRVGQAAEARSLYEGLLGTCLAGAGHHGLGLLAGQEGRRAESLGHLRQARLALPADPRVRSDFGYALLLDGQLAAARMEFLTAQDLDPEDRKAAMNLLLLLFRQGDAAGAEALARRYQVADDELARLRGQAEQLSVKRGDE